MDRIGMNFLGDGKIYLEPVKHTNVYKYGEEIHSLYRALNNIEASVNQLHLSLQDVERAKNNIKERIILLEEEVMKMKPVPKSSNNQFLGNDEVPKD